MTPPAPRTSSRLLRAAAAERSDLDRHRIRLVAEREELQAKLARIDAGLAEVDERLRLLDRLAPAENVLPREHEHEHQQAPRPAGVVLRGPAIRQHAVYLLQQQPGGIEALHYRDWYELVLGAGFLVAGKDPLAVFLTQVSRSPVIRRSTQSGVYELDRDAPARLQRERDRLQRELRELSGTSSTAADLASIRERRAQLTSEIGQTEKALEEAMRLLGPEAVSLPRLAAAS